MERMKEYIERAAVKNLLDRYAATDDALALIDTIPTAGVVEVKHGRWIPDITGQLFCSECKQYGVPNCVTKYCPNCGARMDKEGQE